MVIRSVEKVQDGTAKPPGISIADVVDPAIYAGMQLWKGNVCASILLKAGF